MTLTGLYGNAHYIYFNTMGNSVVDHICVSERDKGLVVGLENDMEVMGRSTQATAW